MHGTALAEAWFNGVVGRSPKRGLMHLWFYLNEWIAAVRADALVGVSASTLRWYPGPAIVIPNGVDVAALAPDGTPKSAHPTVLFVGQVDSRKRGRLLLSAMREVRAQIADAELWIVGSDPVGSIVEPGVRVLGAISDAELRQRLRAAWVMCLPSAYEGFGRPYVEALAAGTTAVATPNPGAREVLGDGRWGVIAEDAALASTLVQILRSPDRRAAYESTGPVEAARYDWDVVAAAYEGVYARVLERPR
jgi:glycosyltransferase involved in cell wall biosynthesis